MSLYCPECWAKARCIDSRCDPLTNSVIRRHQCSDDSCKHRFTSIEVIPGHIDMARMTRYVMVKAAIEMSDVLINDLERRELIEEARRKHIRYSKTNNKEKMKTRKYKPSSDHPWRRH